MSENATDITNDNIQDNNGNDSLLTGGSLYESSTDKYKDNLSSAITFFVCGGIGIILMILNDIGIIKIVTKDAPSFLFINIVLGLLFVGFIAIGVWSLKYSNKIKAKAETEDKKAADVLNWLEDNITKEDIENSYTGDIQEEMKYFNRTAYVKEQLTVQFTELSDEEAENFSEQFVEKMFN
jgi:Tetraspanin family.